MGKISVCQVCGKEFEITGSRRKYCSKKCSEKGYRIDQNRRSKERNQREREKRQRTAGRTKKLSPLDEVARKAREAGMTYGQYVALDYANIKRG